MRQYLPSELSIADLWKMYNKDQEDRNINQLMVKYDYFRVIFETEYNISFKTPASDSCSQCLQLMERIGLVSTTAEDK